MKNLKQNILSSQKEAMKAKDEIKLSTLRMLSASIANKEIELKKKDEGLSDDEIMAVISTEVKKRRDAAEGFEKGDRAEMAEKEKKEMEILKAYLPPEISDDELRAEIQKGIKKTAAQSLADLPKVMKIIMPNLKGKADGGRISGMLKEELNKLAPTPQ